MPPRELAFASRPRPRQQSEVLRHCTTRCYSQVPLRRFPGVLSWAHFEAMTLGFTFTFFVFHNTMLRARPWLACPCGSILPVSLALCKGQTGAAVAANRAVQGPCSAAQSQCRTFEVGVIHDKLSNAIREYRHIVNKDRLRYHWDRKVGADLMYHLLSAEAPLALPPGHVGKPCIWQVPSVLTVALMACLC